MRQNAPARQPHESSADRFQRREELDWEDAETRHRLPQETDHNERIGIAPDAPERAAVSDGRRRNFRRHHALACKHNVTAAAPTSTASLAALQRSPAMLGQRRNAKELAMATGNAQKIGWIGMGRMGFPMAERLIKAGHDVSIWNRTRAKAEPLAKIGGRIVDRLTDLESVDVLFSIVATGADVQDVLYGKDGVAGGSGR